MPLSSFGYATWVGGMTVQVFLCALAIQRGLFRRLPCFSSYLLLVTLRDFGWWTIVSSLGYTSRPAFYFAWAAQAVLLCARALAIAELCQRVLNPYRGVWALVWRLLAGIVIVLVGFAGVAAMGQTYWIWPFVLTLERGLELAAAAILISLFATSAYYRIHLEPVLKTIALGLCFYSVIQVMNNSVMREWLQHYFSWWAGTRVVSFQVALVLWWWAMRKPLPVWEPAPVL